MNEAEENLWAQAADLCSRAKAFAIYKRPDASTAQLIVQQTGELEAALSLDKIDVWQGYVVAPFYIENNCPLLLIRAEICMELPLDEPSDESKVLIPSTECTSQYSKVFQTFIEALQAGKFKKIVLSRNETIETPAKQEPLQLMRAACNNYPNSFVSLWHTEPSGTWLMASPEVLIEKNGQWHTMALAGTQTLSPSAMEIDTSGWDEKNRREQNIVEEYIEEVLQRKGISYLKSNPRPVRAGQLSHLCTHFYFNFPKQESISALLKELHPTPAVCGLPKETTLNFIREQEPQSRKYYAGFNGPLQLNGETHLFVTLRCMNIQEGQATLYAGGGLIDTSKLENEWKETIKKMSTMKVLLTK